MNTKILAERIRCIADDLDASSEYREHFHEAELIRVLARLVEGKSLQQAFGAPGDWGYQHPIGNALALPPAENKSI